MLRSWLIGAAVILLAPLWVPLMVPILVGDILAREWRQTIWEQKRKEARGERDG